MEDSQIIEAFWQRKESAIADVRVTYENYCGAIARNILEDEADVEEILNDTWLKAWNAIPPAKPKCLKLYLARITRNLAFDRFRSQNREKRGSGNITVALEELSECIGSTDGPESILEAKALQLSVNQFLGTLSRRDRSIFLLRYFHLDSSEEIAARLHIRTALVRTVLSRTRRKLKEHLKKEGFLNG